MSVKMNAGMSEVLSLYKTDKKKKMKKILFYE